ncbi:hypothetical protein AKJ09_05783 [Labilithrix luteola]|uniref:IgGFc-binding protein N-terminal domain-containing protein n=1 Tax=Labilithrix luteola TaxID=1391654 RepID=A0A0K1Q129_9BACT|nr:IgGFc-binding protein [Labilithrix luteola]AKU99119.1 hypothetical protein AKJ09_05783 [Labilithrix luteola]
MLRSVSSHRLVFCLLATAGPALVSPACSKRTSFDDTDGGLSQFGDASSDPVAPKACGIHCSPDLKQVLTGCEGAEQIVASCNPDQGCGDGECVEACTAAELTKGSAGCDFWATMPDSIEYRGGCFVAMIANTWDRAVGISAGFGDTPLDISKSTYTVSRQDSDPVYRRLDGPLPPGQVAIVFLAQDLTNTATGPMAPTRCPTSVTPALSVDPTRHGTGKSKAFHIETDAPISAYSMYPYGGADSFMPTATLLLPVSSWSKNYIAVTPFDFGETRKPRSLQIVANQDDTEVRMKPTAEVASGPGVAGATTGVVQTWTLAKGEVLQFLQSPLGGSPIETSKPVGMFGGSECTELPTPYCDVLQQQIPPFAQWGTEYAVVPFRPRMASFSADAREKVPYSIVGAVDGTTLTYEPSRPRDAPETIGAGEVASFITDTLFVVKSQDSKHPFHVNVYMTGATYAGGVDSGTRTFGDPDFVNVPPVDQYLDRYVFFTDFTYPETALTIVRRKTTNGFVPVELECAGELTGFQPLGTSGLYEFAWIKLTSGYVGQTFSKGQCGYGRHEAHSTGPFAVTVWGTGIAASYGYVGGTSLRTVNDAPPPVVR